MGANLSTSSNCASSLLDLTKEDIASSIVEQLGSVYAQYGERIIQHNISGAVLWSFRKELYDESNKNLIQYILNNDLSITNSIHQRVLYLEFQKLVHHEEERLTVNQGKNSDLIPTNIVIQKASVASIKPFSFVNENSQEDDLTTVDFQGKVSVTANGPPQRHQDFSSGFSFTTAERTIETTSNTVSSASALNEHPKMEVFQHFCESSQSTSKPTKDSDASRSDESIDDVVLCGYGPIHDVTRYDVAHYEPPPTNVLKTGELDRNDSSALPVKRESRPRTAMLPIFHNEFSANRMENSKYKDHLPDNYYSTADQLKIDHSPIHIHDANRVALLESFSLQSISPSDPTGIALKRITDLAAQIFDCDYVEVTFLTHDKCYNIANHMSCSVDSSQVINSIKIPILFNDSCSNDVSSRPTAPWLAAMERGLAFCNYVAYTGRTFTLNDVYNDESFAWAREAKACQFYSASPIIVRGCNIASLCVYDFRRPHPEFSTAHQIQQEQLADMAAEHIENWVLRLETKAEKSEGSSSQNFLPPQQFTLPNPQLLFDPPESYAAVVFTDVQGSTSLWEFNPAAMQGALSLHDQIIRQSIVSHRGYEIKTEGDSFQILFHECHDAALFALAAQQALHHAPWSQDILSHPIACEDANNALRGLRVRMAIHYGPVSYHLNEITSRREYTGSTIHAAKSLESLTYGGQILVTSDAWNRICHLTPTVLGSPQVLDLGAHILLAGSKKNEGIVEKSVFQLIPRPLAFDYQNARTMNDDCTTDSSTVKGRKFPKLPCIRRLSASFQDAPHEGNVVTILFLVTTKVEEFYDESAVVLSALAKHVSCILRQFPKGYQCKDFMLAFPCPSEAIRCGLMLQDYLRSNNTVAGVNLKNMIKIGLHHGPFTSMGPDLTSGRADYYGVVVNRAARIADAAQPGEVVMGVIASTSRDNVPPSLEKGLKAIHFTRQALKGINEDMDLYNCSFDRGVLKRSTSHRSSRRVLVL